MAPIGRVQLGSTGEASPDRVTHINSPGPVVCLPLVYTTVPVREKVRSARPNPRRAIPSATGIAGPVAANRP
jgi:hypothetical protein